MHAYMYMYTAMMIHYLNSVNLQCTVYICTVNSNVVFMGVSYMYKPRYTSVFHQVLSSFLSGSPRAERVFSLGLQADHNPKCCTPLLQDSLEPIIMYGSEHVKI